MKKMAAKIRSFHLAHLQCALNFQMLDSVLRLQWVFALALDDSSRLDTSYLDVRVQVACQGQNCNYHVAALSMSVSHTGLI